LDFGFLKIFFKIKELPSLSFKNKNQNKIATSPEFVEKFKELAQPFERKWSCSVNIIIKFLKIKHRIVGSFWSANMVINSNILTHDYFAEPMMPFHYIQFCGLVGW
jgi:hypothetical protein